MKYSEAYQELEELQQWLNKKVMGPVKAEVQALVPIANDLIAVFENDDINSA